MAAGVGVNAVENKYKKSLVLTAWRFFSKWVPVSHFSSSHLQKHLNHHLILVSFELSDKKELFKTPSGISLSFLLLSRMLLVMIVMTIHITFLFVSKE